MPSRFRKKTPGERAVKEGRAVAAVLRCLNSAETLDPYRVGGGLSRTQCEEPRSDLHPAASVSNKKWVRGWVQKEEK